MNLRYALDRFNEIPYLNLRERLFASKLGGSLLADRFINKLASGYPVVLENSAGHPLLTYKITGNIIQNETTVTENAKLHDSNGDVILDSEGNEIRSADVVTYNSPSPDAPAEVLGCGDLLQISFNPPLYGDGTPENSDICDLSTGVITRRWGVKVFDGTERWAFGGSVFDENCYQFFTALPSNFKSGATEKKTLNTHFVNQSSANGSWIGNWYNVYPIKSLLPENATVNDFKAWLSSEYAKGTPVTVYYPLAEPTTENITVPSGLTGNVIGNTIQNGTPTPETPIEVSGLDKYDYGYEIPVVSRGKNLFDLNAFLIKYPDSIVVDGDTITIKRDNGVLYHTGIDVSIPENSVLSLIPISKENASTNARIRFLYFDDTIEEYQIIDQHGNPRSFSPVKIKKAIKAIRFNWSSFNSGFSFANAQLELGSEATEYEPYRTPITTPIYLPEPLYKDDYIYKDKSGGKVHREWGVKVFDGSEGITIHKTFDSHSSFRLPVQSYTPPGSTILSTHGKNTGFTAVYLNGEYGICSHNNRVLMNLYIAIPNVKTLDDMESFLKEQYAKGTPVTVYYPLAEPTEELIDLPDIPTLDGTTIIETDTEIPPSNIEVTYKARKPKVDTTFFLDSSKLDINKLK